MPIDAMSWGILVDPTVDLRNSLPGVSFLAGQEIGFSQSWEMLLSIYLVNYFGITCCSLVNQIIIGPKTAWPTLAGDRVPMPVDISADVDPAIAEELHLMLAEPFRLLHRGPFPFWKVMDEELLQSLAIF
jgi:hypothetical protein